MKKARKQNRKYLRGSNYRINNEKAARIMIRNIAREHKLPYVSVQIRYNGHY